MTFLDHYKDGHVILRGSQIDLKVKGGIRQPRVEYVGRERKRKNAKIAYEKNGTTISKMVAFKRYTKEPLQYEKCCFCNKQSEVFHHEDYEIWNFGYFMCYSCHRIYHSEKGGELNGRS